MAVVWCDVDVVADRICNGVVTVAVLMLFIGQNIFWEIVEGNDVVIPIFIGHFLHHPFPCFVTLFAAMFNGIIFYATVNLGTTFNSNLLHK